jgi:hypothetical protein
MLAEVIKQLGVAFDDGMGLRTLDLKGAVNYMAELQMRSLSSFRSLVLSIRGS